MAIRPTRPTPETPTRETPTRETPGRGTPTTARPAPARPTADRSAGPPPTFTLNFRVTISNREIAVARISPLELAADPAELKPLAGASRSGGRAWAAPPLPCRIVLARAVDGDRTFYDWRREAIGGKPAVRTVTIRQLDRAAENAVNGWQLVNAWPLRWTGPAFDALDGGIAFEEIELVFTDLNWL